MKIACGMSNLRRTHKDFADVDFADVDFADVVELIEIRKLDSSFACFLHKSLRSTFGELVRNANAGEDE